MGDYRFFDLSFHFFVGNGDGGLTAFMTGSDGGQQVFGEMSLTLQSEVLRLHLFERFQFLLAFLVANRRILDAAQLWRWIWLGDGHRIILSRLKMLRLHATALCWAHRSV